MVYLKYLNITECVKLNDNPAKTRHCFLFTFKIVLYRTAYTDIVDDAPWNC